MYSTKAINIITITIFNLVPIIGVAFYSWSPFQAFWLFWMETLIISFFNAIRIMFSQQRTAFVKGQAVGIELNIASAIRYLLVRIAIFFFYSIFIVAFIGFVAHQEKDPVQVVQTLAFQNHLFNLALLLIFCTNTFYLIKYFFFNNAYLYANKKQYSAFFDGRQIVMHIAVVVGAVGAVFLFKGSASQYASVWIIAILCVIKSVFELLFLNKEHKA